MTAHLNGYAPKLTGKAKDNRKNMTPEEKKLRYQHLNKHYVKFYRQRPILNFIADFLSNEVLLVIEIDGSQHYPPDGLEYDT